MESSIKIRECDLYPPVKAFLESHGYEVKGEVLGCDVMAVRGTESPVVVELKLSLNLGVVLQAVERLSLADDVYIGIPQGCRVVAKQRKRVIKTLRMLGLGLLVVAVDAQRVDVFLEPGDYQPRKSKRRQTTVLNEFHQRIGDPTAGGSSTRQGVMTVYRQRALLIGTYLLEHESTKASVIAHALKEPKARDILYQNVYGWFERVSTGVYAISPKGKEEVPQWG